MEWVGRGGEKTASSDFVVCNRQIHQLFSFRENVLSHITVLVTFIRGRGDK